VRVQKQRIKMKTYIETNHLGNVLVTVSARPRLMYDVTTFTHKEADVTSVSGYYPFGSLMPERHWQSEPYSFGFNGKESDNEIKGSGNSYDFGARIYDSRLGRWLSLDPLAVKYPDLSPYHFSSCNPILFVDYDGKDYGVHINHNTETIIIKATYYTTKEDVSSATKAIMAWNEQTGKYQYKVGDKYYDVVFQLTVKDVDGDYSKRDEIYFSDESGFANTYGIVSENAIKEHGVTEDGPGDKGGSRIFVKASSEKRETSRHEIGHTLGLGHWWKGVMKKGEDRKESETYITKGMVRGILKNANIGKNPNIQGSDRQASLPNAPAKATVTSEGKAPDNFNEGKIIKKRK